MTEAALVVTEATPAMTEAAPVIMLYPPTMTSGFSTVKRSIQVIDRRAFVGT